MNETPLPPVGPRRHLEEGLLGLVPGEDGLLSEGRREHRLLGTLLLLEGRVGLRGVLTATEERGGE